MVKTKIYTVKEISKDINLEIFIIFIPLKMKIQIYKNDWLHLGLKLWDKPNEKANIKLPYAFSYSHLFSLGKAVYIIIIKCCIFHFIT